MCRASSECIGKAKAMKFERGVAGFRMQMNGSCKDSLPSQVVDVVMIGARRTEAEER